MGLEILKIEMRAVKSRLEATETHTNQLSEVVGDVIQAVRDNDKHYHEAFAVKSPEMEGMTLRDQFAMAALQGLVSRSNTSGSLNAIVHRHTIGAAEAYAYADAMLVERAKSAPQPQSAESAPDGKSMHLAGDKDGWITWIAGGKDCPVMPDVVVDVRLRDGTVMEDEPAGSHSWSVSNEDDDIVAYRVVRP